MIFKSLLNLKKILYWFFIAYHICGDIMLALLWNCGFGVINIASNYDDGFRRPNTLKETTFFHYTSLGMIFTMFVSLFSSHHFEGFLEDLEGQVK